MNLCINMTKYFRLRQYDTVSSLLSEFSMINILVLSLVPPVCFLKVFGNNNIYLNIGYPNTYDNDLSVSIPIEVTSGSKIELTFLDMDIENASTCEYDYLQGGHHYFLYNIFFNMFVFSF